MRTHIAAAAAFLSFVLLAPTAHAQMMGGYVVSDDGRTAREEAEGKVIVGDLANGSVTCDALTWEDFERIGEYYMGLMVGDAHVSMNAMMERQLGEEGEEQMHILMGKRLSGCDPTAGAGTAAWGSSWFPMMGMMGGISGRQWGYGMMGGSFGTGWGLVSFATMGLFWAVGIAALVTLLRSIAMTGGEKKK